MTIDSNTILFFDASCLIAAAGRPDGGSGFLLSLCSRRYLKGAVSQPVLLEAQRNIQDKLTVEALNRFYQTVVVVPFILAPVPPLVELEALKNQINEKDLHVVAAASAINTSYLLTLDKGLEIEVKRAEINFLAYSPGEFIKTILPEHVDFPLRNN